MVKVHFCRSSGPAAWLIRAGTMSRWNHVAIEICGEVYHATGLKGVHKTQIKTLKKHYEVETICLPELSSLQQVNTGLAWLEKQLGKGYDFGAILAFPFRTNWQDPDRWFCSELVAAVLRIMGLFYRFPVYRVTPRDLGFALSRYQKPESVETIA